MEAIYDSPAEDDASSVISVVQVFKDSGNITSFSSFNSRLKERGARFNCEY